MTKEKTTKKLELKGNRLLFFGGVYSNLEALHELKDIAEQNNFAPDQIICNGDIVGYCANPEECIQEIKNWGIHTILGNVEIQLRDQKDDCGCDFENGSRCDLFSKRWFPFAQTKLSQNSIDWLKTLPDHLKISWNRYKIGVVHGSFDHCSEYVFESTDWGLKKNQLLNNEVDMVVGGHSGLPFHQSQDSLHWLNPGVIGMPANDGTSRVWYCVVKAHENQVSVSHYPFEYNKEKARQSMIQNALPLEYAKTLISGLWDNCEILPVQETERQGEKIEL